MKTKNPVGRPPVADKAKNRSMSLNNAEYAKFRQLGGIKWLKKIIYLEYLNKCLAEWNKSQLQHDDDWVI